MKILKFLKKNVLALTLPVLGAIIFFINAENIKVEIKKNDELIQLVSPKKIDIEILVLNSLMENNPLFLKAVENKITEIEDKKKVSLEDMSLNEIKTYMEKHSEQN